MNRQIDLTKKQDHSSYKSDIELNSFINDPYLAVRIEKYSEVSYDFLQKQLFKNPFLYYFSDNDLKIEYFDDFCIKYNSRAYSIGGLCVNKSFKNQTKKKVFNQYYNNWKKQYEIELFDTLNRLDNISNLSDSFLVKHFKLITIGFTFLLTLILCLISFPTKSFSEFKAVSNLLDSFHVLVNQSKLLKFMMNLSCISGLFLCFIVVFYEITSRILYHRYTHAFSRIEKLIKKIKRKTSKLFKNIKKHYYKQFKSKKIVNYPMDKIYKKNFYLKNIDELNKTSINKLSNFKKRIIKTRKLCVFTYILTILINITFIVLLIIQ